MKRKSWYVLVWAIILGVTAYCIRFFVFNHEYTYTVDKQGRTRISWENAKILLYDGQVDQVMQTHEKEVTLELKNGEVFLTKEPRLDLIFLEIQQCGLPCKDIIQATE